MTLLRTLLLRYTRCRSSAPHHLICVALPLIGFVLLVRTKVNLWRMKKKGKKAQPLALPVSNRRHVKEVRFPAYHEAVLYCNRTNVIVVVVFALRVIGAGVVLRLNHGISMLVVTR